MRIQQLVTTLALGAALAVIASPVAAQSLKKVGSDVHKTLQKAGNQVKEVGGDVGSATHKTLTKAGKDVKAEAKRTGVKPIGGDVGKAARKASKASKKTGRSAKASLKKGSSDAHHDLTETGKAAKETVKKP